MNKRRDALIRLAAAGAFGAAGFSGLLRDALAAGRHPVTPGIHRIKGNVRVNRELAREGRLIRPGDTVVTGSGAEAIYVIGDDAFLQRENSEIMFGAELARDFFRVLSGRILSVFGKGEKTLQTSTATIGIRGTGCYIEGEEKRVYFCLCYGTADLVPTADPAHRETIRTTHHDRPVYIHHESGMPMMVDAKVINHDDVELSLLESLCGRVPGFSGNTYRPG